MQSRVELLSNPPPQLPDDFVQRMRGVVPRGNWDDFLKSFSFARRSAIRINTLKSSAAASEALRQGQNLTLEPIDWSNVSFAIQSEDRQVVSHLPQTTAGEIYIQSLSSQLASVVLDPQPCEWVLDLAAAPGGKASHMAALMQNTGRLSCVEPIRNRFFRLQANLKTLGVQIAKYYQTDGRTVGDKVGERFDRVLLDAPCSGEARFSLQDPDSFATWSLRKIRETSRKQIGLIKSGFQALKPGGRMLYATCSFAPEENEFVVAKLLELFPEEACLLPITVNGRSLSELGIPNQPGLTTHEDRELPRAIHQTARILPDHQYEGFFLALIEKRRE